MDRPMRPEYSPEFNTNNIPLTSEDLENQRLAQAMNLQLTPQELKILKECQHNAVYQRGVPVAAVTGGTLYYLMRTGNVPRNPMLVVGTTLMGFLLGTMSYRSICMEKLLALPASTLKERILQAQGQQPQVKLEVPSQDSGSWFESMMPTDTAPMGSSLDFDTHVSNGFDDVSRTQNDLDTHYAIDPPLPPATSSFNTYDDLRRQNREQYQRFQQYQNQQPPMTRRPPMGPGAQSQQPPAPPRPADGGYYDPPPRPADDDFVKF